VISFISQHPHDQPSLEDIVAVAHVSPFHFQRIFLRWAGVGPKKFVLFLSSSQRAPSATGDGHVQSGLVMFAPSQITFCG
tara:strand:- start:53 stop:292 length:240 start_codon:yes stop_codon:yes gene_type:complete